MNRFSANVLLVFVCSFFACAMLWAQIPATRLEGEVLDPAGNPVSGAKVTAARDNSGYRVEGESDDNGEFVFPALLPGIYTVTVEASGYKPVARTGVRLDGTGSVTERFTVVPGSAPEPETEEAVKERLSISESQVSGSLSRRDLEILPQRDRLPLLLSIFQPGIQIQGGDPGSSVVNGNRQESNNITLDGVDANDPVDPRLGFPMTSNNFDSVDQFVIVTAGAKAEYGRNAGAQVLLTTRAGGERWFGNIFDYYRDKSLNANDFFNNSSNVPRPRFTRNIYGASLGGPLMKDRTFLFANYQGRRTNQGIPENRLVLTPTAKSGVFQWIPPGTTTTSSFDIVKNDPRKIGIDPRIASLLGKLPDPNITDLGDGLNTSGFRFNNPNGDDENQATVRLDHNLTDRHRLFGRLTWQQFNAIDSANGADATFPGESQGKQNERRLGFAFGSEWSVSAQMFNELRAGYQDGRIGLDRPARVSGPMFLANSWTNPLDPSFARRRNSPVIGVTDNLTWIRGAHVLKGGVSFHYTLQKNHNDAGIYPDVTFARANGNVPSAAIGPSGLAITPTDRQTFENLYNDLLGRMDQVTQTFYGDLQSFSPPGTPRDRTFNFKEYGFFLQDDWKVRPNLTVNLGLRYEFSSVPSETNSIQASLDKASSITPAANISDFTLQRGGAWYNTDATGFAPRIGFAWRPLSSTKTVVRGGYGIYYDRLPGRTTNFIDANTPNTAQTVSLFPNLGGTDVRLSDGIPAPAAPALPALKLPNTRSTSIALFTPDLRAPRIHQYHLSVQRQVMKDLLVEAGYAGERGTRLFTYLNLNQLKVEGSFLQAFQEIQQFRANGTPVSASNTLVKIFGSVNGAVTAIGGSTLDRGLAGTAAETVDRNYSGRYAAAGVSDFYLRNFTQYDQFIVGTNDGKSYYDSVYLNARMNKGPMKLYLNYTISKTFDNISSDCSSCVSPIDSFNPQLNKALSDFYHPRVFNAWVQYAIPLGNGRQYGTDATGVWGAIISNWDLGVLLVREKGSPFSVSSGLQTARADIASYANYNGSPPLGAISRETDGVFFFTPDQVKGFTAPVAGSTGSTGRNAFMGPDYFNMDVSLLKDFLVKERRRATLRIEVYNIFNHPNFGGLGTNMSDTAGFARFSAMQGTPRQIQVALRYQF